MRFTPQEKRVWSALHDPLVLQLRQVHPMRLLNGTLVDGLDLTAKAEAKHSRATRSQTALRPDVKLTRIAVVIPVGDVPRGGGDQTGLR